MAIHGIAIKRSAEKDIRQLPSKTRARVTQVITRLAEIPCPYGSQKLSGKNAFRLRIGVYRIIYVLDEVQKVIEIVRVAHRKEVYR